MSERETITTWLRRESDGEGGVRDVYRCEVCRGTGQVGDEECTECDGLGEWFE